MKSGYDDFKLIDEEKIFSLLSDYNHKLTSGKNNLVKVKVSEVENFDEVGEVENFDEVGEVGNFDEISEDYQKNIDELFSLLSASQKFLDGLILKAKNKQDLDYLKEIRTELDNIFLDLSALFDFENKQENVKNEQEYLKNKQENVRDKQNSIENRQENAKNKQEYLKNKQENVRNRQENLGTNVKMASKKEFNGEMLDFLEKLFYFFVCEENVKIQSVLKNLFKKTISILKQTNNIEVEKLKIFTLFKKY